ncbi:hypothetical protein [Tichowtungia aerotolerans]|uniref:Uncharacterized protein n=1 Tax=Tichowtungia aerotolerans TaxID=2697043 RepID=A0A6P1MEL3_9BACT|nr:hypothetical protein [Tichowtungia aerotolerans]QHI69525.1 hypothetical protein GT409_08670 [Tichowtungia aerotolerans]
MKIRVLSILSLLAVVTFPGRASDLVIQSGGALVCQDDLMVESGKITVTDGAVMVIDNASVSCQDFQLDSMSSLAATGTLSVSRYWINKSDFVKPSSLSIPKEISSISDVNLATGFGDTDGDGITDRGEGSFDANTNGVADFLDPSQAEPMAHIPVEWLASKGLPSDHSEDYGDSDGDGASNWNEYHAMTDPLDSNSLLKITEYIRNHPATGEVYLTWSSVNGRTYELQYSTNLLEVGAGFATTESGLDGAAVSTSVSVEEPLDPHGFYRIKVNP